MASEDTCKEWLTYPETSLARVAHYPFEARKNLEPPGS